MNCPACYSEIDDRSYRCKECHRITSYRRFNRNYDFVFSGFEEALHGDVPAFDEGAAKLDALLGHLEDNYKTITIVAHGKGALLAMRTLLNRAKDFPKKQPYRLHRIVMF